jgi:hypothetical protein
MHAEQGFGDTLQFARFVPIVTARVAARGARSVFEVPAALLDLMTGVSGAGQIVAAGEPLPDFDLHCPLLSLPQLLGTRLDTIPNNIPYLSSPAAKAQAWRERLGEWKKPRIGLVWSGNPRKELLDLNLIDRQRSIALDKLAPLFDVKECSFYSLQKGDDAVQQLRDSMWRDAVIDLTEDLHDFSDTAALIENLDLVISVDTSVVHLVGALGKPIWLLNRYNTCWRWLLDRDDSPWYPSLRQFRQDQSRDWAPVIRSLAGALGDHVGHFARSREIK